MHKYIVYEQIFLASQNFSETMAENMAYLDGSSKVIQKVPSLLGAAQSSDLLLTSSKHLPGDTTSFDI